MCKQVIQALKHKDGVMLSTSSFHPRLSQASVADVNLTLHVLLCFVELVVDSQSHVTPISPNNINLVEYRWDVTVKKKT